MAKVIKLSEINSSVQWIETKIKGDNRGWLETSLKSFSGKTVKMFGDDCLSFERWNGSKKEFPIVFVDYVSARVKIWNKETYENEIYKIIF
tara:strand:+ start:215 stop:487 length:273 start_codon:yes stop_codon:yes gene_type:complete